MTKNVTHYLELLDISEDEAQVYLKLLQTGAISGRDLAKTLGIPRTTVYNYLDLLIEKGLVMKLVSGSRTQFAANQPTDCLPFLVDQKVQASKQIQDGLPHILDTLQETFPRENTKTISEAEIKYYKGKNGVKKIYEEALQARELRSYVNIAIMYETLPENSQVFAHALKNNKTLKMYEIIEDSAISREQTEFQTKNANHERYFYKFLPKEVKLSAADTLIYDGKVAVINVRNQITGVVFQNTDHYNNLKALFDSYWNMLPDGQR